MITVRGNKAYFKGKEAKQLKEAAKSLGISVQDTFTGMMWEYVMKSAREGVFLEKAKDA